MSGYKKIKMMLKTGHFGDVKRHELENFLNKTGFIIEERKKHIIIYNKSGKQLGGISRGKLGRNIPQETSKSILTQCGLR